MNSLSVNLHLLLLAFYRPTGSRNKILVESGAFPSDFYLVSSHIEMSGNNPEENLVEIKPRDGEKILRDEDIIAKIHELGDSLALVLFPGIFLKIRSNSETPERERYMNFIAYKLYSL